MIIIWSKQKTKQKNTKYETHGAVYTCFIWTVFAGVASSVSLLWTEVIDALVIIKGALFDRYQYVTHS